MGELTAATARRSLGARTMTEAFRLTVEECLAGVTREAARALGLLDEAGTLAPGKTADIIAVVGSPLQDVTRLEHVSFVMHRGVVATPPGE